MPEAIVASAGPQLSTTVHSPPRIASPAYTQLGDSTQQ